MPRYNIQDLPQPPYRYRPRRSNCNLETKFNAKSEDRTRSLMLQTAARVTDDSKQAAIFSSLSKRLNPDRISGRNSSSLASSRFMRAQRVKVIGNLWQAVDQTDGRIAFVTLIPPSWRKPGADLALIKPELLMQQIRTDLNRVKASMANGFLFAGLHGDYDPVSDTYQPHVHAIATGGMIAICNKLRRTEKYWPSEHVRSPVRLSRRTLFNLPEPLTYCMQSWWPSRPRVLGENGAGERGYIRRRIPNPRHAEFLVWLDRQKLSDITLLMKIRASKNGLV